MKLSFLVLSCFLLIGFSNFKVQTPQSNSVQQKESNIQFFNGTWQEALNKAKQENKLIFLDIYATWCGPCKLLKKKTFTDKEVAAYFNKNFINVSIDGEAGAGPELARKYNVRGYPSLIFLKHDGSLINQALGYYKPKDFLTLGRAASQSKI